MKVNNGEDTEPEFELASSTIEELYLENTFLIGQWQYL